MIGKSLKQDLKQEQISHLSPEFVDRRGEILNVLQDFPLSHVAVITTRAGMVRGNHWHPEEEQLMYLISGAYISYSRPIGEKTVVVQDVLPGDLVYCPPGVAHAYLFLEESVFLNLGCDNREKGRYGEHTVREMVIAEGEERRLEEWVKGGMRK